MSEEMSYEEARKRLEEVVRSASSGSTGQRRRSTPPAGSQRPRPRTARTPSAPSLIANKRRGESPPSGRPPRRR